MDQNLIGIIVGVLFVVSLVYRFLGNKKMPPTKVFRCAGCKKNEAYSKRTIEAWRNGYKRIYCNVCHQKWLKNNPNRAKPSAGSQGCAVMAICLVSFPIAAVVLGWAIF